MSIKLTVSREIAYDTFVQVMEHKKNPDECTESMFNALKTPLKRVDRNFVKEILFGGLRWYSKIYWILQKTSSRDLSKSSPEVRASLVLGTYQIFYMDRVPDRSAVNESVEYIRKKGQSNAVKFVNGILRTIARRSEYFAKPDKDKHPVEYLALQFAHPKWIVERWSRRFKFDRMKELLASNNQTPPYTIRVNSLKVELENIQSIRSELLKKDKNQSERKALRTCLSLKSSPNFAKGSLFQEGFYSVQDESSQLIANLLQPSEGQYIIDACTGPGGKLSHIYELAQGKIDLVAVERNAQQMKKAQSNAKRLGHENITWSEKDFLEFKSRRKPDKILLDAPCSGLGVLRRHPEGKWLKSIDLVHNLATTQKELIEHSIKLLKKGGELVYSVCSFEEEETIDQLNWIQKEFGDMIEVVSPLNRLPDYYKKFVTRDHLMLVFSGNKDLMDGFGAFIIRKK